MTQEQKSQTGKRGNPEINSSMKQLTCMNLKDKMNRGGGLLRPSGIPVWQELQQCMSPELLLRKREEEISYFSFLFIIPSVLVCSFWINPARSQHTQSWEIQSLWVSVPVTQNRRRVKNGFVSKQAKEDYTDQSMQIIF